MCYGTVVLVPGAVDNILFLKHNIMNVYYCTLCTVQYNVLCINSCGLFVLVLLCSSGIRIKRRPPRGDSTIVVIIIIVICGMVGCCCNYCHRLIGRRWYCCCCWWCWHKVVLQQSPICAWPKELQVVFVPTWVVIIITIATVIITTTSISISWNHHINPLLL